VDEIVDAVHGRRSAHAEVGPRHRALGGHTAGHSPNVSRPGQPAEVWQEPLAHVSPCKVHIHPINTQDENFLPSSKVILQSASWGKQADPQAKGRSCLDKFPSVHGSFPFWD